MIGTNFKRRGIEAEISCHVMLCSVGLESNFADELRECSSA